VCLPGVERDAFLRTLREEVLPTAPLPDLNRVTNVVAQTLLMDENEGAVDTCLWAIYFNGVHHPELVREKCEAVYEGIQDKLEAVGVRSSFRLETLEARWETTQ
jgi:hypothetical protein